MPTQPSRSGAAPRSSSDAERRPRCRRCRRLLVAGTCPGCYPNLVAAAALGTSELFGWDPEFDGPSQLSLLPGEAPDGAG